MDGDGPLPCHDPDDVDPSRAEEGGEASEGAFLGRSDPIEGITCGDRLDLDDDAADPVGDDQVGLRAVGGHVPVDHPEAPSGVAVGDDVLAEPAESAAVGG